MQAIDPNAAYYTTAEVVQISGGKWNRRMVQRRVNDGMLQRLKGTEDSRVFYIDGDSVRRFFPVSVRNLASSDT